MKYFAKIKYLGTSFHGFQVQPGLRTVQSELSDGLSKVFGEIPRVTGCSRTDAGVHANEFCVKIESDMATVPPEKLPIAVSRFLPPDLSLFYAEECAEEFHPRYDVVSKEYLYRIKNRKIYDPFDYGRAWFLPRNITCEGLSRMREAAKYIISTAISSIATWSAIASSWCATTVSLPVSTRWRAISAARCACWIASPA